MIEAAKKTITAIYADHFRSLLAGTHPDDAYQALQGKLRQLYCIELEHATPAQLREIKQHEAIVAYVEEEFTC